MKRLWESIGVKISNWPKNTNAIKIIVLNRHFPKYSTKYYNKRIFVFEVIDLINFYKSSYWKIQNISNNTQDIDLRLPLPKG